MAITDIDKFINDYKKMSVVMLGNGSIQNAMLVSLEEAFREFQLTNEQVGEIIGQVAIQTAAAYNKDALTALEMLIKAEQDLEVKKAQAELLRRQKQGYDDNMLLKIVEHQASITSFAINANSKSAQETINTLKAKMVSVEARVKTISGTPPIITPPLVVPAPTNPRTTIVSSTEIDIVWDAVVGATQYFLYRDGVLIATSAALLHNDDSLTAATKYAYSVKASINGVESDYSTTVMAITK